MHGVLILRAVQPAQHGASVLRLLTQFIITQRSLERRLKILQGHSLGPCLLRRRHLAFAHTIIDLHPAVKVLPLLRLERQRREIQPAFLHLSIMTLGAVLFQERNDLRQRCGTDCSGEEEKDEEALHGWNDRKCRNSAAAST